MLTSGEYKTRMQNEIRDSAQEQRVSRFLEFSKYDKEHSTQYSQVKAAYFETIRKYTCVKNNDKKLMKFCHTFKMILVPMNNFLTQTFDQSINFSEYNTHFKNDVQEFKSEPSFIILKLERFFKINPLINYISK